MLKKSFTLIELLVVIAIIGILASLIIANMASARAKARDARRKADLGSIRTAIEMYIDANNTTPQQPASGTWTAASDATTWTTLQTTLNLYLTSLPRDPQNGQAVAGVVRKIYRYGVNSDGYYELDAYLESDTTAMQNDGGLPPAANTSPTWRYEIGSRLDVLGAL